MATVAELIPGDLIHQAGMEAVYVTQSPHPLYPGLQLVVWKMPDGTWSMDALRSRQEVGHRWMPSDHEARQQRLRDALLGEGGTDV